MPQVRRKEPLIFAVVTALAMVAAILAWALIGGSSDSAASPFSSDEQKALDAAQTEVANFNTLHRASFDADYARAERGLTGPVLAEFKKKKTAYEQALTAGKFDLTAKITHVAFVGKLDNDKVNGYQVLVSFNGYKSTQQNAPTPQNLSVTIVSSSGKWLINDFSSISVSS